MGQQQLLLLVLSTVIVGLATVAGIQAFSENQAQASQDALVQRGTSIASDVQGLFGKPGQMGGIDDFTASGIDGATIVERLGYDTKNSGTTSGNNVVSAEGAGAGGACTITTGSTGTNGNVDIECQSSDAPQTVTVTYDPDDNDGDGDVVSTSFSS